MKSNRKDNWTKMYAVCLLVAVVLSMVPSADAGVSIPYTFSAGSTISSSQVNADFTSVANQMPAVKTTYMGVGPNLTISTNTQSMSLTVTTPGSGSVIVSATGTFAFINVPASGDYMVRLKVSETSLDTSETAGIQFVRFYGVVGYDYYNPISVTRVFPVSSAGTHTYYLNTLWQLGSATTRAIVYDTSLTAIFVPNALP